jgi:ComF family protein
MLKSLVNLLFPVTCPGCENPLQHNEAVLCTTCRHGLPFTHHYKDANNETAKKFLGRVDLEHASALLYFHKEGITQQLIHNLKYRAQQQVGHIMGEVYAPLLQQVEELQSVTHIIPIPLHPKKLRERGYNQVAKFGKALSGGLTIPYNDEILVRAAYNKTQTKKNRELRGSIINRSFAVNFTKAHHDKHFLLVDDVITTGATLEACGKLLLGIPGAKVSIVTIAYAHS